MLPRHDFIRTNVRSELKKHFLTVQGKHLKTFFHENPKRFENFSINWDGLLFDYSKNHLDEQAKTVLLELARECELKKGIEAMFEGEPINETEHRSVLHVALRNQDENGFFVAGNNLMPQIDAVKSHMKTFSEAVIQKKWTGFTGKPIENIVNIGIGGSDLGPHMVTEALKAYKNHLHVFYVSNIDGAHLAETLKSLNPETTLFLIASKTFTTQETMANAYAARDWLLEVGNTDVSAIAKHFVAISTNSEAVKAFGIDAQNMFEFWDWVGGRYSLWGAIGLSIVLSVGYEHFESLLKGAYAADQHFRNTAFEDNIPVIMGLTGIWYNNFFECETQAIIPYAQDLHRFPAYLQQCDMESNGKSVDRNGNKINYQTGPIIWGEPGTNSQHAFFQLIHQGTKMIPVDFIGFANSVHKTGDHHNILLANFFAQSEALMNGTSEEHNGKNQREDMPMFKKFDGNRPSNSFLFDELTPYQLGKLIALYEHKIFVQGIIWNIYSFDQWGVELGKKLANQILPELKENQPTASHDSSTNGLINTYKRWKRG